MGFLNSSVLHNSSIHNNTNQYCLKLRKYTQAVCRNYFHVKQLLKYLNMYCVYVIYLTRMDNNNYNYRRLTRVYPLHLDRNLQELNQKQYSSFWFSTWSIHVRATATNEWFLAANLVCYRLQCWLYAILNCVNVPGCGHIC